jgi:hypothetical protein
MLDRASQNSSHSSPVIAFAAATANRHVLASGRNLEVIPATLGACSWKVAAFEGGGLQFFADLTDLNEAKTLSAREAGRR